MSKERAGDQVFENVDLALAEKIMARSKENSSGPAPVYEDMVRPVAGDAVWEDDGECDGVSQFGCVTIPALKAVAAFLALAVFVVLIFWRRNKKQ